MKVTTQSIDHARETIAHTIHKTPLFTSSQLSSLCGNTIWFKGEHLQKTGSFKIRGATNKVEEAVKNGASYVTTASSGNHGQAVAYIAKKLNIDATIVVPEDANPSKTSAIHAYGGKVERCGTTSQERLPYAMELARQKKGVYIPPYDDPMIIAGQGTIGIEILEELEDVDVIIVPIGGGGLISGIATVIKEQRPSVQVIGVEPEIANDTYLSLQHGQLTSVTGVEATIADGLRTSQPGEITFPIVQKYVDEIVLVSEKQIREALSLMYERTKQIIEPSSAVTVAAVLFDQLRVRNKKIVCILSGGNVDIKNMNKIL